MRVCEKKLRANYAVYCAAGLIYLQLEVVGPAPAAAAAAAAAAARSGSTGRWHLSIAPAVATAVWPARRRAAAVEDAWTEHMTSDYRPRQARERETRSNRFVVCYTTTCM